WIHRFFSSISVLPFSFSPHISLQILHQPEDAGIAVLGTDHGTPLDHPPQASLCQSPGGVLTGEHDVEHDTQGVDIRPGVGLCKAKLFWGGIAHRTEDLCILSACGVILPGGVKINENGGPAFEKDIPWL